MINVKSRPMTAGQSVDDTAYTPDDYIATLVAALRAQAAGGTLVSGRARVAQDIGTKMAPGFYFDGLDNALIMWCGPENDRMQIWVDYALPAGTAIVE